MKHGKKLLWLPLVLGMALLTLFLTHNCLSTYTPSERIPYDAERDFSLMAEAWNTIQNYYVDRSALDHNRLRYGAISGMTNSLGDTGHTVFLTPDMNREQQKLTKGNYKGVGIEITLKEGQVVIVAALDGSPAQKAGLHSGEIIKMVDDRQVSAFTLAQVGMLVSGPLGTHVKLTILDPATNTTSVVTLTRASIKVKNVRWALLPSTGAAHLRIAVFSKRVTDDLNRALEDIRRKGIKSIILDLRDDPGGVLEEAVGCTSQFLKRGNVLLEKDAAGIIRPVPVKPGGIATDIPLIVIVNGGSASAAEIMAGALKDAGRAELVGVKTFGTGTVLQQFTLSDGSALMLAVEEWLTPDGHTIWHKGIAPNYVVGLRPNVLPLFPGDEKEKTLSGIKANGDIQLLTAIKLIKSAEPKRSVVP